MTKYIFTKNIDCTAITTKECSADILFKLETLLGGNLHVNTETELPQGHLSISHEQGNHKIWVFLYDTDGEHEGETDGTSVKTPNSRIKAWALTRPTLIAIKAAL